MMKLGYARVSTSEQDTAAQVSALKSAGCEKIFREKASEGVGIDPNYFGCWIKCVKAIFSSSHVLTGFRARCETS
jgi:hypothetical protein